MQNLLICDVILSFFDTIYEEIVKISIVGKWSKMTQKNNRVSLFYYKDLILCINNKEINHLYEIQLLLKNVWGYHFNKKVKPQRNLKFDLKMKITRKLKIQINHYFD